MFKITGFIDEISADFNEQTRVAADIGLKYVELRSVGGKFAGLHSAAAVAGFKKRLDETGLQVSCLASPIGKVPIGEPFAKEWERFKQFAALAVQFETKNMRLFSFYIPQDKNADEFSNEIIDRIARMAEYAGESGLNLLHENEKGIFGDLPQRCLLLANKINMTNFKLIFDFANFVQCKQDVMLAYDMLKEHIAYYHAKDEKAATGESVPAGQGDGQIEAILKLAHNSGYSGFLSLEPHLVDFAGLAGLEVDPVKRNSSMSGEEAFRQAYTALQAILKKLEVQRI